MLINKIIYAGTLEDYYSCSVDRYVEKIIQIDNAIKKHKKIQPPYVGLILPSGKMGIALLVRPKYAIIPSYVVSDDPYYVFTDNFNSKFENISKAVTTKFDEDLNYGIIRVQYIHNNIKPIKNYYNICLHDPYACKEFPDVNTFKKIIGSYESINKINSVKFYDTCLKLKSGRNANKTYYVKYNGNEVWLYSNNLSRVKFLIIYASDRRVFTRSHFTLDGNSYEYSGLHPDGKILPSSFELFKY
jgi:hypothetical protein